MSEDIYGFEYLRQKALKSRTLLSLHMDITYRCPQRCVHCYIDSRDKEELSLYEIENILKDARELNTMFITLSGGEVFQRKDFFSILEIANRLRFSIKLITSGYLIGKKEVDLLKKNRVISVGVSLYSTRSEIHDAITQIDGSCKRTMHAIRLLSKAGLLVVVKSTIMRQNYLYYPELLRWSLSFGENVVPQYDMVVTPTMGHRSGVRDLNLSFKEKKEMYQKIQKINKKKIMRYEDQKTGIDRGKRRDSITCYAGFTGLYIDPEGKVFPCVEWQTILGDLRKESLIDIWNKSKALKKIQSLRIHHYKACMSCKYLNTCSICPGLNIRDTQDIFTPSPLVCDRARMYYQDG